MQAAYGKPDLEFRPPASKGAQHVQVFVDRTMPKERLAAVLTRFPTADRMTAKDIEDFWRADLRGLARLLGPEFRGAIVTTSIESGKLLTQQAQLVDLVRARTVFNLGDTK